MNQTVSHPAGNTAPARREARADIHCYLCGHTVKAVVLVARRQVSVKAGEKCGRCGSSLGAATVVRLEQAA